MTGPVMTSPFPHLCSECASLENVPIIPMTYDDTEIKKNLKKIFFENLQFSKSWCLNFTVMVISVHNWNTHRAPRDLSFCLTSAIIHYFVITVIISALPSGFLFPSVILYSSGSQTLARVRITWRES